MCWFEFVEVAVRGFQSGVDFPGHNHCTFRTLGNQTQGKPVAPTYHDECHDINLEKKVHNAFLILVCQEVDKHWRDQQKEGEDRCVFSSALTCGAGDSFQGESNAHFLPSVHLVDEFKSLITAPSGEYQASGLDCTIIASCSPESFQGRHMLNADSTECIQGFTKKKLFDQRHR